MTQDDTATAQVDVAAFWAESHLDLDTGKVVWHIMGQRKDEDEQANLICTADNIPEAYGLPAALASAYCPGFVPGFRSMPDWVQPRNGFRNRGVWLARVMKPKGEA